MTAHECSPAANPRRRHICVKCGKPIRQEAKTVSPAKPSGREREPSVERSIRRSLGVDPGLAAFAEARCHPGPIRGWESRDLVLDGREELADFANYLTWELQRISEQGGPGERFQAVAMALQSVSEAWQMLGFAERHEG